MDTSTFEAESISYAVCQYFGIQTGANSFGYIANWSQGKELKELRASLETINKTAGTLIADIDRHFQEVCKERGIDLESGPEQDAGKETMQPENPQADTENQEVSPEPEPSWKIPTELPEQDPSMFRYYITQESLDVGTYPLMDGKTITELAAPVKVEQDSITAFGCIDYPQPLTAEQEREYALLPASQNPRALDSIGHAAEAAQLPDAPEQTLDEYPMPDPLLREDDLKNCGYQDGDLLPLSKERALELFEQDLTVYAVVDGGGAEMLFDREEFESQLPGTVFALSREEWEESPAFDALVQDRLNRQHFDCWASRFGETVTALELAPEGTGYRARTRFSKFFNLPELMNLFKEVADIKTADQLDLPTPEVEYHNIVAKPTEHQQDMVKALSERAAKVHSGTVDPSTDNMLKITSDGRKLGLDQRIINPMLPDEPGTKVNQCVDNILQIWRDGQPEKLTQLVFCDISTPQAAGSKKVAKTLDNPILHALEQAVPEPEKPLAFTVYEDIRQKLIAQGMPASQIAFIHEANTEVRKKELFSKVRSGQVRVLLGSTQKMGAGTNVQDLLVALHDLDCPWRPGDLAQRKGRIERQGNQNPLVHVYRYVTEGTFDAYLWQTVENKQKFISQIMTSKSPVRSCDDVDETALSFAEIKALCAGDPRIKERMDLDVEVSRLKLMKADHQSKQYRLEDQLLKHFPEEIEKHKGFIQGLETDMETLAAHPHPTDGFTGMEVRGDTLTDKENAGAALLDACKEVKGSEPVQVGSYRGFAMFVTFDAFQKEYMLQLKGRMTHRTALGADPRGNLTRIDNALSQMPQRLESVKVQLDNLYQQQAAAKEEVGKAFPYEEELRVKNARLVELDMELNMDSKGQSRPEAAIAKRERPSVLEGLKRPIPPRSMEKKPKQQEQEAR